MQTTLAPTPSNGSVRKKVSSVFTDFQVLTTTNYSLFKTMYDNRSINENHVRRLIESMKSKYLICPIIVNEKHQIIDGQHRFRAIQELGLPVYYIIISGYGIEEIQILNTNQKNWDKMDYLHSYCSSGKKPYLEFKQFMEDFPTLSFQSCERILTGFLSGNTNKKINGKSTNMHDFINGKLIIPDLHKSYTAAKKILDFEPFYPGFYKGMFATVILSLLRHKQYNHKEMLHKLSVCPIKMQDCLNVESYKMLLEDIYNHKRQKENKVSFRYAR